MNVYINHFFLEGKADKEKEQLTTEAENMEKDFREVFILKVKCVKVIK